MPAQAEDFAPLVEGLATDGFAAEQQAVAALGKLGDRRAAAVLEALRDSRLLKGPDGRVLISDTKDDKPRLVDAVTGAPVSGLDSTASTMSSSTTACAATSMKPWAR